LYYPLSYGKEVLFFIDEIFTITFFRTTENFFGLFFFYAQPAKEVGGFTGYAEGNSRRGDSPM
jgi:hypothetical protein